MHYRYDARADILAIDLALPEQWTIPALWTTDGKTIFRLTGATVAGLEMLHASASYPVDWLLQKTGAGLADQVRPAISAPHPGGHDVVMKQL